MEHMNLEMYRKMPDYVPNKQAMIDMSERIISMMMDASFTVSQAKMVFDIVTGEFISHANNIPVGKLLGYGFGVAASASPEE